MTAQSGHDLPSFIGSGIHHGKKNAIDFELRVNLSSDLRDGVQKKIQTFGGQKRWLRGDDDAVCGREGVDGHHTKRRRTVY